MAKATTFELKVQITPLSGKPTVKTVKVPASATLREVAEAAGITEDVGKKNFLVNGDPATLEARVTAASNVQITERPQGS